MLKTKTETTLRLESLDFILYIPDSIERFEQAIGKISMWANILNFD